MSAEARLKEKNITLPKPSSPMANYVGAVRTGNLLFVSGHGPVRDGKATSQGKVGKECRASCSCRDGVGRGGWWCSDAPCGSGRQERRTRPLGPRSYG